MAVSFEESFDGMLRGFKPERSWAHEMAPDTLFSEDEPCGSDERTRLDESGRLEEMAIRDISRWDRQFKFKICIKDPETGHVHDPHAHLMDSKVNGKDLMRRLKLFDRMPRSVDDIQDAFPNDKKYVPIEDDWKQVIFDWAKKPNKFLPKLSNWEAIWMEWCYSVNK